MTTGFIRMPGARIAAALAFAVALAAAVPAAGADKLKLTVPSNEIPQAAYYVALEKGYFAQNGLDVELTYAGGGTATPALISGSVDGSGSAASALSAILRGAPLQIVLMFQDSPTYQLWASSAIRSVADLKGKTVGIATRGDTYEIATRIALQQEGLNADDVGFTPLGQIGSIGAALGSGAVPAAALAPYDVAKMKEAGQLNAFHLLLDYSGKVRMPWNGFVVADKFVVQRPDVAKRLVKSIVQGTLYAKAFKAQTIAIVGKYKKGSDAVADARDYDAFVNNVLPDLTVPESVQRADLLVRAKLINVPADKIPPVKDVYDFALVRAAIAELAASRWKPAP